MAYDDDYRFRWWAHPLHDRKVNLARHDAFSRAVERGRRAFRNQRILATMLWGLAIAAGTLCLLYFVFWIAVPR